MHIRFHFIAVIFSSKIINYMSISDLPSTDAGAPAPKAALDVEEQVSQQGRKSIAFKYGYEWKANIRK